MAVLLSLFTSLGGLGGTFWSTLIGAIVGALSAGTMSFVIQERSNKAVRLEREQTKRQETIATASLAMVKVIRILSDTHGIKSVVDQCIAAALSPQMKEVEL